MKPRPNARGRRRFRTCAAKGCEKCGYWSVPYCPSCRVTLAELAQAAGVVLVLVAILVCP